MKIAVLLNEPYPSGMACTNRTHLYSKGLAALGNDIEILIPQATEEPGNIKNYEVSGEFEGVKFKYAYESIVRGSFLGKRIQNFISFFKTFIFFIHFKPKIILIVTNTFKYILIGKVCSFLLNAKIVREKTEVPFYISEKLSYIQKLRARLEFKLFDGLMVISDALKSFFINDLSIKINIIKVPILVDSSKEELNRYGLLTIRSSLVYSGSLENQKDGIFIIIKAFAKIIQNHSYLELILTGDLNKSCDKEEVLSLIDKLNLIGKVKLAGYVSKEKLNEFTYTALALLSAKPENRQNHYNMATKIGEYLLTGRPVIVSSVDTISHYLLHSVNAFIVEPDDNQIAAEIEFIVNHANKANRIGLAGREAAINLFDYNIHSLRINDFFERL